MTNPRDALTPLLLDRSVHLLPVLDVRPWGKVLEECWGQNGSHFGVGRVVGLPGFLVRFVLAVWEAGARKFAKFLLSIVLPLPHEKKRYMSNCSFISTTI